MGNWNSCCLYYTTRCYSADGETLWIKNYWQDSKGDHPGSPMSVAIDSEGNAYTCGQCAESSVDCSTWSLISYDPEGVVRWKKDIRRAGRSIDPAYASWSGDMYAVTVTADDRIAVIGAPLPGFDIEFNNFTKWSFHPDGTSATFPFVAVFSPSPFPRLITADNEVAPIPALTEGRPSDAACVRGASWIVDGGITELGRGGFLSNYPTLIQTPRWIDWSFYAPSSPPIEWAFWALRYNSVGEEAGATTVCTSPDGSLVYASGTGSRGGFDCVLNDVGVLFTVVRIIPNITNQSLGIGLPPLVPGGGDTIVWGAIDTVRTSSVGFDGGDTGFSGVVMGGGSSPQIKFYNADDGSKIWAHNHQQISDLAATSDRVISVGPIKNRRADESFV